LKKSAKNLPVSWKLVAWSTSDWLYGWLSDDRGGASTSRRLKRDQIIKWLRTLYVTERKLTNRDTGALTYFADC